MVALPPELEPLTPVLAEVRPLAERFDAAGHRLYLVGGVLRDLFAGRRPGLQDLDLTSDARPDEIRELVAPLADALWRQGERFGTVGAHVGDRTYEITTHRAEVYRAESRKPTVSYTSDLDVDLGRRDFTVNAIAVDVVDPVVVDPYGGRVDLAAGVLRTPLDPEISFSDDPLRMQRALRFVTSHELEPVEALTEAMTAMRDRLTIVSIERRRDELEKLIVLPDPTEGLVLAWRTRVVEVLLPELLGADPVALAGRLSRVPADPTVRFATLAAGLGAGGATRLARRYRESTRRRRAITSVVETAHLLLSGDLDPAGARHLLVGTEPTALAGAVALALAASGPDPTTRADVVASVLTVLGVVAIEGVTDDVPIGGHDVLDHLGGAGGPWVGEVLDAVRAERLATGPLGRRRALEIVDHWAARRPDRTA